MRDLCEHSKLRSGHLLALTLCCFTLYCLDVFVPFPYCVWGMKWNSTVSVPDHCPFIHLTYLRVSFLTQCSQWLSSNGRPFNCFPRSHGLACGIYARIPNWGQVTSVMTSPHVLICYAGIDTSWVNLLQCLLQCLLLPQNLPLLEGQFSSSGILSGFSLYSCWVVLFLSVKDSILFHQVVLHGSRFTLLLCPAFLVISWGMLQPPGTDPLSSVHFVFSVTSFNWTLIRGSFKLTSLFLQVSSLVTRSRISRICQCFLSGVSYSLMLTKVISKSATSSTYMAGIYHL